MAATRARTELAAAAASTNKDDTSLDTRRHAAATAPADNATADQTPARRTTTRTRKLPSRLLPSPSPPPSRPTSLYNAARHAKGTGGARDSVDPTSNTSSTLSTPTSASASAPTHRTRKSRTSDAEDALAEADTSADRDANLSSEDLGPGKRKRRPSSMYKPPSTLTSADTPSPAANPATAAAAKQKKKGRSQSPDAASQKTHTTTPSAPHSKLKARSSKSKFESTPSSLSKPEPLDAHADDSDAELDITRHSGASKRARLDDADDLDLSPPPLLPRDGSARVRMPTHFTQPTFIRGGRVSVSPEASAKRLVTFGIRDFNRPAFHHADTPTHHRHNCSPAAATAAKRSAPAKRSDIMSSSPISAGVAKFDSEHGAPLTYVPYPCAARNAQRFQNTRSNPFANDQPIDDDEDEEDDDDDDENDFHQAMLDADFDFFDSQKTDGNTSNNLWKVSQRAATDDAADVDDTPATTPRSPQSGCDLPSPGSPRCKAEDEPQSLHTDAESVAFNAVRDSVFAHALPTTQVGADKPCQHAGSLTLSLPYTPAAAVSSPRLRAMELESDGVAGVPRSRDAAGVTQTGTPVLQRRKHAALGDGAHGLVPLKLGAELMERSTSNAATYMQLSPMIEMDSPLLSPGLTLGMHGKSTDLPSPFIMGVDSLPELEHPAALDLPPAHGSTTPKSYHPEVVAADDLVPTTTVSTASSDKEASNTVEVPEAPKQEVKVQQTTKAPAKVDKPAARRPALPPPRQIRFTTLDTPCSDAAPAPIAGVPTPQQQQQQQQQSQPQPPTLQQAASGGAANASPKLQHATPDLVHSGSSSPDSASDSPSPLSQAGSSATGEAEVETLLFGPPEKLDLHELDSAWNGSKAALRRANGVTHVHNVDVDASRT